MNLSKLNFCDTVLLQLDEKQRFDKVRHEIQAIFSNIEHSYIKKVCFKFLRRYCNNHKDLMIDLLIDHFLLEDNNQTEEAQLRMDFNSLNIQNKCALLKSIFSDADPTYLENFVEKNENEEKILEFIESNLENKSYLTKIQSFNKTKNEEFLKIYVKEFNVSQFLEIVYDPIKEFECKNRLCQFSTIGYQFLNSFFSDCEVTTLNILIKKIAYYIEQYLKKHDKPNFVYLLLVVKGRNYIR